MKIIISLRSGDMLNRSIAQDMSDIYSYRIMDLYLFRHGCTRYNAEHRYQGKTDLPLLESEYKRIQPFYEMPEPEGIQSISGTPEFQGMQSFTGNPKPERVYVSPALRARQTAGLLFPGLEQIVIPEFAEMDFGIFEGRSAGEMEDDAQYREWVDSMCEGPVPGGECKAEYTKRVTQRFYRLVCEEAARGCGGIYIAAHGGTQMALMERYCVEQGPYWTWQTDPGAGICAKIVINEEDENEF